MHTTLNQECQELVDIYSSLSDPLKKQLIILARVIVTTQEITLSEDKQQNSNLQNIK